MSEQLWSNKDIINRALEHAGNGMQPHVAWERTAREMRDDYQQRIEELEAENTRLMTHVAKAKHEKRIELARQRDDYAGLQSWCKAVEERLQADIDQQKEDMAEIERLRSLLPSAEVLRAICDLADDAAQMDGDYYAGCAPNITAVFAWMDKLKGEVNND